MHTNHATREPNNYHNNRRVKSISKYQMLFKLIEKYIDTYGNNMDTSAFMQPKNVMSQNERTEKINDIIKFTDCLAKQSSSLQESDKTSCLIQSLQLIKKLYSLSKNQIETRSKRVIFRKEQQVFQEIQRSAMQKLAQFLLNAFYPRNPSSKNILNYIYTIISELKQHYPDSQEQVLDKKKTKKSPKRSKFSAQTIECRLQNGSKIDLVCYLVFRILQKNLQDFHLIKEEQDRKVKETEKEQLSIGELVEKNINGLIRKVIEKVLIDKFEEINVLKDFVSTAVKYVTLIQLPILPFFIKVFYQVSQKMFKNYYAFNQFREEPIKISPKEANSFENLNTLLQLTKVFTTSLISFQFQKKWIKAAVCSFCGVFNSSMEMIHYQRIIFKLHQSQNLVAKICEHCCKHLNVVPSDKVNLRILGPIILSTFWKTQIDNYRASQVKNALSNFVKLQSISQEEDFHSLLVTQKIAMNNSEESIPNAVIQKIYTTFILFHSQLQISTVIIHLLRICIILWNSKDAKIKQKSIKLLLKSSILQYITNNQLKSINKQYSQKVSKLPEDIAKGLINIFSDKHMSVALISLQLLVKIYINCNLDLDIFDPVFQQLLERKDKDCQVRAFQILEKLCSRSRSSKIRCSIDLQGYTFLTLKLLKLFMDCLRSNNEQNTVFKQKTSKMITSVLSELKFIVQSKYIHQCEKNVILIFQSFFFQQGIKIKLLSPSQIVEKTTFLLLSVIDIDASLLKNLPVVTIQMLSHLIQSTKIESQQNGEERKTDTIYKNIIYLIKEVYSEVSKAKQIVFGGRIKESNNSKTNLTSIQSYIHSSAFIERLLQPSLQKELDVQKESMNFPDIQKLQILKQLLYFNALQKQLTSRKQMNKYFAAVQKSKRRSSTSISTLTPLILSKETESKLQKLADNLVEQLCSIKLSQIEFYVSLIVNILCYLGRVQKLEGLMKIYERYCIKFYNKLVVDVAHYNLNKTEDNKNNLDAKYTSTTRCFHIGTFFATFNVNYQILRKKMDQLEQKQLSFFMQKQKSYSQNSAMTNPVDRKVELQNFKNFYLLTINLLQISDGLIQKDLKLSPYYKQNFLLLRFYFEVDPKIIFMQPKLMNILNQINADDQESIIIVKYLYKLFESLLPSTNLELLNFIRDQFSKKFHTIIKSQLGKKDLQFAQISFSIIYHLLRSGMEGFYSYNKYLYLGLFHISSKINSIAQKIIQDMYDQQIGQRALFLNLGQSLSFTYQVFFNDFDKNTLEQMVFTQDQIRNLAILSEVRLSGTAPLLKSKKQLRLGSTFLKKMSDYLDSQTLLLKNKPLYFIFVLKILKCQKIADFYQLNQILQSLYRLTSLNHCSIEDMIYYFKNYQDVYSDFQNNLVKAQIMMAYRQLVSCTAYFTKYKQVTTQIKAYQKSLDNVTNPYINFQEEIQMTPLQISDSYQTKIDKISRDILLFFQILVGGIDYAKDSKHSDTCDSNQTDKTKPKVKNVNPKKSKSKILNSRPRSVEQQARSQEESQLAQNYINRLRKNTKKIVTLE